LRYYLLHLFQYRRRLFSELGTSRKPVYSYHYTNVLGLRPWQSSTLDDRRCTLLRHSDAYLPEYTRPHNRKLYWCLLAPRIREYSWCGRNVFVTVTWSRHALCFAGELYGQALVKVIHLSSHPLDQSLYIQRHFVIHLRPFVSGIRIARSLFL
jgi:hypothetical protein